MVRYNAYVLMAANRQNTDLALNISMSLFNVTLNLMLIPEYSHTGAAIATLTSICFYAILQSGYIRFRMPEYATPVSISPPVIAAIVITSIAVWTFREVSIFLALISAPLVYAAALVTLGFFTLEELKILRIDNLVSRFGHLMNIRK